MLSVVKPEEVRRKDDTWDRSLSTKERSKGVGGGPRSEGVEVEVEEGTASMPPPSSTASSSSGWSLGFEVERYGEEEEEAAEG